MKTPIHFIIISMHIEGVLYNASFNGSFGGRERNSDFAAWREVIVKNVG